MTARMSGCRLEVIGCRGGGSFSCKNPSCFAWPGEITATADSASLWKGESSGEAILFLKNLWVSLGAVKYEAAIQAVKAKVITDKTAVPIRNLVTKDFGEGVLESKSSVENVSVCCCSTLKSLVPPGVLMASIFPAFSHLLKVSMETPRILAASPIFTNFADGLFIVNFAARLALNLCKSVLFYALCIDPVIIVPRSA